MNIKDALATIAALAILAACMYYYAVVRDDDVTNVNPIGQTFGHVRPH